MEVFFLKKHAIGYKNRCKNKNSILFQEDIDENKKRFLVSNYEQIYNKIIEGRNNLYESWDDKTNLYYGIDLDIPKEINKKNVLTILRNTIEAVFKTASKIYNYEYKIQNIFITKSSCQKLKYSFHINFRGLVFENVKACKQFYDKIKEDYSFDYVDDSIYRLTCLRMTFCTKKNSNSILEPYVINYKNQSTGKYNNNKSFWYNTLITNVNLNEKMINTTKTIKNKILSNINTNSKNIQLETLLEKLPKEYNDDYNKWIKVAFACYNENVNNYDIFDKWSSKSKKYNKNNNLKIWNSLKENNNKITISSLFYWLKEENIDINNMYNNCKNIVDTYPKMDIKINDKYNIVNVNKNKLSIHDMNDGIKFKLFAIQSEKGTGKTTSLIQKIFTNDPPEKILFISSRRTFGVKLYSDLKKYNFKLYSEIKENYIDEDRIIIQLDSLHRLRNIDYDLIIIDECESLARYMTSNHFLKNKNSSINISDMEYRILSTDKLIIMDADLSDRALNYFKKLKQIDYNDILVLKNIKTPFENYTIKYTKTYNHWVTNIINMIQNNKKLVIPMASNNKAKDLYNLITSKFKNKKVLIIHKETNDNDKLQKLLNINKDWIKYDIIIYTPTVCMGVSFDVVNYFDNICAYGCHNSLGSQEFCQMLHRVREPKSKDIYISLDNYKIYDITEDTVSYSDVEEMITSVYYLTRYDIHNNLIPKKFGKDRIIDYPYKDEAIYELYIKNNIERINDINNFSKTFFSYIKYKKYKLEYILNENDKDINEKLKEINEERKVNEKNKTIDNIINANNLTKEQYNEKILRKDEFMDQETLFSINKYNLVQCYDINYDDLSRSFIEAYYDKNKMKNYTNLKTILNHDKQTTNNKLLILKNNEKNYLEYSTIYEDFKNKNKFIFHYLSLTVLKYLGFDINDYDKKIINKDIIEENMNKKINNINLIDFLDKESNTILYTFNIRKKLNEYDLKSIITFVNKILENQYGLTIKKKKDNYFLSSNDIWQEINRKNKIISIELSQRNKVKFVNIETNKILDIDK